MLDPIRLFATISVILDQTPFLTTVNHFTDEKVYRSVHSGPGFWSSKTSHHVPVSRGGTASLKVGTHCQTTAPAFWHCPPLNLFLPPPIFEGHRPPPPKIKHSLYKIIYKSDPKSSKWLSI